MDAALYTPASLKKATPADATGVLRTYWSSVSELLEDAFDNYGQSDDSREFIRNRYDRDHVGDAFANFHTVETLKTSICEPSSIILKAVEEMREQLADSLRIPTQPRRKIRRGQEWGDELDADCYLSREPNAWDRNEREQTPRRAVTIGINLTVYWCQKPEELLYRGAAAVALADLLTQRGCNVRVVGFIYMTNVNRRHDSSMGMIELKAADMPMDVASLATAVCDIGFTRMVIFSAIMRHTTGYLNRGVGYCKSNLPKADKAALDYVIDNDVNTREAATAWLNTVMGASNAENTGVGV